MAVTTAFEKFAKQQREINPDITDEEIQSLWSQQPVSKRIASGIESAVVAPVRAGVAASSALKSAVTGPNPWETPALRADVQTENLWGEDRKQQKLAEAVESKPQPIEPESVESKPEITESIASLSTSELKKQTKKQLSAADTTAKKAQADADAGKIPQAVADDFKTQRDEAYRRYDEAKSRNEWLELAQILGQAVTQYGAAQVGMRTGRSMAGLQIPEVDYSARTAQEQRLLESRLRDISGEQERQDTLAERLRRQRMDEERMAMERRELSLKEREALLPKTDIEERQIRREERQAEKQDFQSRKTALQKAIGAQQIIASEATTPAAKKKAQEVVAEESAKAGLDLGALTEQSQVRGFFGSSTDQQNILSLMRADLRALEESRQRGAAPATMQEQAPAPLSAEDQQALEWASQNPNDPRAAAIRQRLGR